jgi:hypothetical protein
MNASRSLAMLFGAVLGAVVSSPGAGVYADTIVVDETTTGTVHDSVGDGWFFAGNMPPLPAPDGVGDAGMQALGVALKSGVLELRAVSEFPLADLEAIPADDILSATLTITIDDVLSTFGPGADFGGEAADTIIAFGYDGDGIVQTTDFGNVAGQPLASIDTTPRGTITDANLLSGGAEVFTIDVTTRLKAVLAGSATHFGVVLATDDDNTGTSLDALSPPGVGGAKLPYLTVTTPDPEPTEPPVLGKAALKCQKALAKAPQGYQAAVNKQVAKCFDGILAAVAKGKGAASVAGKCAAGIDASAPGSKVSSARAKALGAIAKACVGVTPAELATPCDDAAIDMATVATCTVDAHLAAAAESLRSAHGVACVLLTSVGLEGKFPLCPL